MGVVFYEYIRMKFRLLLIYREYLHIQAYETFKAKPEIQSKLALKVVK